MKRFVWSPLLPGFLLAATPALAQSQLLIISGGTPTDGSVFRDQIKEAYDLNRLGPKKAVMFAAGDGNWDFAPKEEQHPGRSKDEVEDQLKAAAGKLKPGDTLTIYINDHGDAPKSFEKPLSGSVVLFSNNPAWFPPDLPDRDLLAMIARDVPRSAPVKIVGQICFAGGLNEIAFSLPNVCSATATDFRSMGWVKSEYSHGFWKEAIQGKSLLESHFAGLLSDTQNHNRGQTSSMAYVDQVLHAGPYDPKDRDRSGFGIYQSILEFGGVWPTEGEKNPDENLSDCCTPTRESEFAKLEALSQNWKQVSSQLKLGALPATVTKILSGLIAEPDERTAERIRKYAAYRTSYGELKTKWATIPLLEKPGQWLGYRAQFQSLNERAIADIQPLLVRERLFQFLKKISRFMAIAKPDEKTTLYRLLECEAQRL